MREIALPSRKRAVRAIATLFMMILACAALWGCQPAAQEEEAVRNTDISASLTYDHSMDLDYAKIFSVDYYNDGYKLITIDEEGPFLVVPEGKPVPEDLPEDVTVLQQPLDQVYLVTSGSMDMIRAVDSVGSITLSGVKQDDWYIPEAAKAMADGKIIYAGKYSMPDYELIISEGCDLAIESTMIYHTPEVKEALEARGIPVLVDRSYYEEEPLGRNEWVKLYGALFNHEDLAEAAFARQEQILDEVVADTSEMTEQKKVGFFYITSNGTVNVRKSSDYIPKMIALAGGAYAFTDLGDSSTANSTVKLQMEEFYAGAQDADYLIYNSTIEGEVETIDALIGKSEMLSKFKAVKDGNVWCTSQNMYQESMSLASFIEDVHKILKDPNTPDDQLEFLFKLK